MQVWARGRIVQARGVNLLITLSRRNTAKGKPRAQQALAKIIITTNPSLIPEAQLMDVIAPLIELLSVGDTLQQVCFVYTVTPFLLLPCSVSDSIHC